jgi:hypothetical protein
MKEAQRVLAVTNRTISSTENLAGIIPAMFRAETYEIQIHTRPSGVFTDIAVKTPDGSTFHIIAIIRDDHVNIQSHQRVKKPVTIETKTKEELEQTAEVPIAIKRQIIAYLHNSRFAIT